MLQLGPVYKVEGQIGHKGEQVMNELTINGGTILFREDWVTMEGPMFFCIFKEKYLRWGIMAL